MNRKIDPELEKPFYTFDTKEYFYQIEVNMFPMRDDNVEYPYFWCIMECSKSRKDERRTKRCGWASTPEAAWSHARKEFLIGIGAPLSEIKGMREVYQPEWTLDDGEIVVGNCYENEQEAYNHAACVDIVRDHKGIPADVAGYGTRTCKYIPSSKEIVK